VYLVFAIGGHISLSPQDLRSSKEGFVLLIALVLVFNLALNWAGPITATVFDILMQGAAYIVALILAAMVLNLMIYSVLIVAAWGVRRLLGR
jgi:hypothetical protein